MPTSNHSLFQNHHLRGNPKPQNAELYRHAYIALFLYRQRRSQQVAKKPFRWVTNINAALKEANSCVEILPIKEHSVWEPYIVLIASTVKGQYSNPPSHQPLPLELWPTYKYY